MKWKLFALLGAAVSALFLVMHQHNQKAQAEAELWSEATDSV